MAGMWNIKEMADKSNEEILSAVERLTEIEDADEILYRAIGLDLLSLCEKNFNQRLFVKAVSLLMESYNLARDPEIFHLLYALVYQPKEKIMRENYQRYFTCFGEKAIKIPPYDQLAFLLFPVINGCVRVYSKEKDCFWQIEYSETETEFYKKLLLTKMEKGGEDLAAIYETRREKESHNALCQKIIRLMDCEQIDIAAKKKAAALYEQLYPDCEWSSYFSACVYFAEKNYAAVLQKLDVCLEKRRLNVRFNLLLAETLEETGDYAEALYQYFLMMKVVPPQEHSLDLSQQVSRCVGKAREISEAYYQKTLKLVSMAMTPVRMGQCQDVVVSIGDTQVEERKELLYGEFLHADRPNEGFFVGVYNEYALWGMQSSVLQYLRGTWLGLLYTRFDLMKAKLRREVRYAAEQPCILPIAAVQEKQKICFETGRIQKDIAFGQYEFNFLRLDEDVRISSEQEFAVGDPIFLGHCPPRKKLILNLFIDALSMGELKATNYRYAPRIFNFFKDGVIFSQNYTPAEWTFASTMTIQTGRYQPKTQMFHWTGNIRLSERIKTASEYFKKQGYYCVNLAESRESLYNDMHRGYDRVVHCADPHAYEAVERVIQNLEAFSTDQYISIHLMDIHPNFEDRQAALCAQTGIGLEARLRARYGDNTKSVYIKPSELAELEYHERLRNVDRSLGALFDYIEEHYSTDEYIVSLYSDHGVSIFSQPQYFFDENQGCTALMFKGDHVPQMGFAEHEVTSTIDWYRIMQHLAGYEMEESDADIDACLPRAFGGAGRDYVISNSLAPGQTYKLCIRTMEHEFRLETQAAATYDGKVDMRRFRTWLFERAQGRRIFDSELMQYFCNIAEEYTVYIQDMEK